MYICAEPKYVDPRDKDKLIASPKRNKIIKMQGFYCDFRLPNESLDVVTINAWHIMFPPFGIDAELARCLKPGGLYISAHPIGEHWPPDPDLFDSEVFPAEDNSGHRDYARFRIVKTIFGQTIAVWFTLRSGETLVCPASPNITHRILHGMNWRNVNYVYADNPEPPSLRIWVKK
jgi:SAM-dependent methyltransferase